MNELQIAALIVAVLVGSGALTFFIRYNTRLCLTEREIENLKTKAKVFEEKTGKAEMELFSINQNLIEMKETLKDNNSKLSEFGEINTKLSFIVDALKNTVSSKEFEMHLDREIKYRKEEVVD